MKSVESKILIYIAFGVIVAIIALIAVLPGSGLMKNLIPQNQNVPSGLTAITTEIKPIDIKYNGSSIKLITNKDAIIDSKFALTNPNNTTIIFEMISYDVYANNVLVGHGQYGQRFGGSWESSYYLPLVKHNSETITGNAEFNNDGNNPVVWSDLQAGTAKIRVSGTAYYSTNTAFSGQNISSDFNFTQ